MTDTTPDYAGLIERLRKPGTWARHGDDIIASDAKEELVRDDAPFEAATALRTLLESNAALKRERDEALTEHTDMMWQRRRAEERAEEAEARVKELETDMNEFLRRVGPRWCLEQPWFPPSMDPERAARKFLKENGNDE